jgi:bifunctional non-homologous end joining protein LigD
VALERRFVIQKHAARRLHYDFRLELGGVLVSWAVPKGPSLDPGEKRLAVHVEDHPIEYGGFEGTIPKGQYGGGKVLLWDRGTWVPEGDPVAGLRKGRLVFELEGEKLRGGWSLVRMAGQAERDGDNWLLLKRKDEHARPLREGDVLEERPESVSSGRSMEEIAARVERVWHSDRPAAEAEERAAPPIEAKDLPGARRRAMPDWIEPELATRVETAPEGDAWLHEIKLDGYRILCRIEKGRARLLTRKGLDWTDRFSSIARAIVRLPVERALVDGEVAVVEPDGTTSFQGLQEALSQGATERLAFFAFDLLHLDGWDLTEAPLESRKAVLAAVVGRLPEGPVRFSDHVAGHGTEFFANACAHKIEGIVSKRRDRPYRSGRGRDWVKVKCLQRQDFVIGGWTEPSGSREALGALLLGVRDQPGGPLRYAGKVGTGFSAETLRDVARRLATLEHSRSPFVDVVPRAHARGAHWVEPRLVAEVDFAEWTRDGRLRHPSFQGLREDLPAREVTREVPQATPAADEPPASKPAARKSKKDEEVAS